MIDFEFLSPPVREEQIPSYIFTNFSRFFDKSRVLQADVKWTFPSIMPFVINFGGQSGLRFRKIFDNLVTFEGAFQVDEVTYPNSFIPLFYLPAGYIPVSAETPWTHPFRFAVHNDSDQSIRLVLVEEDGLVQYLSGASGRTTNNIFVRGIVWHV